MKTFFLICVVIAAVTAENVHLSAEQREKAMQHGIECAKETSASAEVLADAKNGNYNDNEDLKAFLFCTFKKAGLVNSNGELDINVAVQKLPAGIDRDVAEKVLKDCSGKTGQSAQDTAYEIFKCFQQGTNQHILL